MFTYTQTNARTVQHVKPYILKQGSIPRFRTIASILVTGPSDVFVLRTSSIEDFTRQFERILHIELRITNTLYASWSIFRQDRHWLDAREDGHAGLVLRYARWDIASDFIGKAFAQPTAYPDVTSIICYINNNQGDVLVPYIQKIDSILSSGIRIEARSNVDGTQWNEILIKRLFDWGSMDLSWNHTQTNIECEMAIFDLMKIIKNILDIQPLDIPVVEEINLKYDLLPEEIAKLISSSNKST